MWRVYNNAVDFERLRKEQLNNPKTCKIGKWIAAQTNPQITGSAEFKEVIETHNNIHKYATLSWEARDREDIQGAMDYFQQTYDAFYVYKRAVENLQNCWHVWEKQIRPRLLFSQINAACLQTD